MLCLFKPELSNNITWSCRDDGLKRAEDNKVTVEEHCLSLVVLPQVITAVGNSFPNAVNLHF
jgi:hypothetical protein